VGGGSGSGKSVLLRSIIGLIRPSGGQDRGVRQTTGEIEGSAIAQIEMRWGVLFQEGRCFPPDRGGNIQVPLREYTSMTPGLMDEIPA